MKSNECMKKDQILTIGRPLTPAKSAAGKQA